jgi:osmotically inducible protein OsmC
MNQSKTHTRAEVAAHQGRDGVIESSDGALRIDLAQDGAPTPEHLFAAAYAACFHSALRHAAERAHEDINGSSVIAVVTLLEEAGGSLRLAVELRASIPRASKDLAERLLHQAHSSCPYSRAVRGNVDVRILAE